MSHFNIIKVLKSAFLLIAISLSANTQADTYVWEGANPMGSSYSGSTIVTDGSEGVGDTTMLLSWTIVGEVFDWDVAGTITTTMNSASDTMSDMLLDSLDLQQNNVGFFFLTLTENSILDTSINFGLEEGEWVLQGSQPAVPEPSTYALLGSCIVFTQVLAKRRKTQSAN